MIIVFIAVAVICFIIVMAAIFADWGASRDGDSGKPKTVATPPPTKSKPAKSKMIVRLTMRTLIRWEQLRGKSFSLMDYSSEEDMEALLYCSVLCCNPNEKMYTLEEFRHTIQNEKLVKQMAQALARESTVMGQFRQDAKDGAADCEATPGCIKDIISTLIMAGLDIGFVMDEMELCDLPLFITAYENKRKEQMESDRLWTYLISFLTWTGKSYHRLGSCTHSRGNRRKWRKQLRSLSKRTRTSWKHFLNMVKI